MTAASAFPDPAHTPAEDDVALTAENATAGALDAAQVATRDPSVAVQVQALRHAYGTHVALHDLSFTVARGQLFGLLGPNGGGKTTLFRILSTLVPPQSGTVRILARDVARERDRVRAEIGVVFQAPALDRKLTVRENLRHQGRLYGLRGAELDRRIDAGLERFRIADRGSSLVERLSGGLRRRAEIAKALLHRPRVLVLDEPSTGLDPGARLDLWQALSEVRDADGVTVLLTSHILEEVERCDRIAILDRGRLVASGSPAELKAQVGGDVVTIRAAVAGDAESLAAKLASRFGVGAAVVDGTIRIERGATPDLVRAVLDAHAAEVASITLAHPTLEDVFIRSTGHRFAAREPREPREPRAPQTEGRAR